MRCAAGVRQTWPRTGSGVRWGGSHVILARRELGKHLVWAFGKRWAGTVRELGLAVEKVSGLPVGKWQGQSMAEALANHSTYFTEPSFAKS